MREYHEYEPDIELPIPYPREMQRWMPSLEHPYPMNFVQAPSISNQVLVYYNGRPYTQGLSIVKGPVMFPQREYNPRPRSSWEHKHTTPYPTTHSVPGPYLQSYIALPNRMYPY